MIHGRPARAKARVLAQNGIATRHYALDRQQRTLFRNSEMAANAVRDLLARVALDGDVDFLAAATTQGDLCVPGFRQHGARRARIPDPGDRIAGRRVRERRHGAEERGPPGAGRREAKRRRLRQRAAEPPLQGEPLRGVRPARRGAAVRRRVPALDAVRRRRRGAAAARPRRARRLAARRLDRHPLVRARARDLHVRRRGQAARWLDGPGLARLPDVRGRRSGGRAVPAPGRAPAGRADPPGRRRLLPPGRRGPPGGARDRPRRLPLLVAVLPHAHLRAAREGGRAAARGEVVLEPDHARERRLRVGVRAAGRAGEQRPRPPGPAGVRHGPRERPVRRQLHEADGRRRRRAPAAASRRCRRPPRRRPARRR